MLIREIRSSAKKLSHSAFYILHLLIPAAAAAAFSAYASVTSHRTFDLLLVFLEIIGCVFPLAAAFMCALTSDQEMDAGSGFFILSGKSRWTALCGKLFWLLLSALFSCLMISIGFGAVCNYLLDRQELAVNVYLILGIMLWSSSVILYVLHLWLGFRFGRSVSLGTAAAESLSAALLMTKLGDTVWPYVPCSWAGRLAGTSLFLNHSSDGDSLHLILSTQIKTCVIIAVVCTAAAGAALFIWFSRWEGRKQED